MMIEKKGDIMDNSFGIIAHGCNCSGGFGSGVAGQIRDRYPIVYRVFKCTPPCPELLGEIQPVRVCDGFFIVNMFTQINYGYDGKRYARLDAIQDALYRVLQFAARNHITKIRVPKIGCGLGGLDWEKDVKPFFHTFGLACDDRDIDFEVWDNQ